MAEHTIVCRCFRVTDAAIRRAVSDGALSTVEQVTAATRAAGGCSSCHEDVQAILDAMRGATRSRPAPGRITPAEPQKLLAAIQRDVVPLLEKNDVHVDILGVESDRVLARFWGRGVGGTLPSVLTLKWFMVRIMSAARGHKVSLIELNILEELGQGP